MPYIKHDDRVKLDPAIGQILGALASVNNTNSAGSLNYIITRLLHEVYGNADNTSYTNINNAMGLLKCVSDEYYRRVAIPYEDKKIIENGDVDIKIWKR